MACWTAAAQLAVDLGRVHAGSALYDRRVVTRKDANARPRSDADGRRLERVAGRGGAAWTREKFATPKTVRDALARTLPGHLVGHLDRQAAGQDLHLARPGPRWPRRRFPASLSTKKGRFRPLSAISW